jgi:6-phosphofructokinase 1
MMGHYNFAIPKLGVGKIPSPLLKTEEETGVRPDKYFVSDDLYIFYNIMAKAGEIFSAEDTTKLLERAGPRQKIFFDPAKVYAAIVTCGGICPGLNGVIRAITLTLWHIYGVKRISGIQYGYRGLLHDFHLPVVELNPQSVSNIHTLGGTILGSSRGGGERVSDIVDTLEQLNVNILFTIGGDGTQKGADRIAEEALSRGLRLSVVGIPKTIDNDFSFIEKSFGFETAVEEAVRAVHGAHTEASNAVNGVGLVKVMGRESGFIAANAALATNEVNFVLVPEVPFDLYGEQGLLHNLTKRLERRGHAVIVVAEGTGQELIGASDEKDVSGNVKLKDIGLFLKDTIRDYYKEIKMEMTLRYIDPSYIIRSAPANSNDSIYCERLGQNAVHAAMSGRTRVLIGRINSHFVHLPIALAVSKRKHIEPESSIWRSVVETTGQPLLMKNREY